jgi:hypothetical protein
MNDKLKRIKLKFPYLENDIDCDKCEFECKYNDKNERRFNLRAWEEELYNFKIENSIKNHSEIVYFCNLQERINMMHYLQGVNAGDITIEGVEIIVDDKKHGFEQREEKPKFNEVWMPNRSGANGDQWFYLTEANCLYSSTSTFGLDACLEIGNCFETCEQAQQRAKEIKVYNLLKNFSDANGGDKIDYSDITQPKSYIYFVPDFKEFRIYEEETPTEINFNTIYFISEEVAEEALRRFKKELEELVK